MKIVISLILSIILVNNLNAGCSVSSDCEKTLSDTSLNLVNFIDYSFNKVDEEIDKTNLEYSNLNNELDKEIYALKVQLMAEQLLYKKLSNIEVLVNKSVKLKDIDSSVIHNIVEKHSISNNK